VEATPYYHRAAEQRPLLPRELPNIEIAEDEPRIDGHMRRNGVESPDVHPAIPVRTVRNDFITPTGKKIRKTTISDSAEFVSES
jgi:hypothetical protein